MPIILLQTLYIDVFGQGLDYALRQMVDVINGNNTFRIGVQEYENVRGEVIVSNSNDVKVIIRAISYAEPISRYAILVDNDNGITFEVKGEQMTVSGFNENVRINEIKTSNAVYVELHRSTTPSFPVEVNLNHNSQPINVTGIMRAHAHNEWRFIPFTI